jgi:hypothetical protein
MFARCVVMIALVFAGARGAALAQATATPLAEASPAAPTPAALYARSVAAMRALRNPPFVTFASAWQSTGLRFDIYQDDNRIVLALGSGRNFAEHHAYSAGYRYADRTLALTEVGSADRDIGQNSHFLDPTWSGAYDLLRYGMHGGPPPSAASPTPAPVATNQNALPTIGTVSAISAAFYRVEDAGAGSCPSGDAGHVLKLTALTDPRAHPLTAVTIDVANDRFCSMRFNLNDSGIVGVTGNYEIHFIANGEYWLVSGGAFDVAVRFLGISAHHVTVEWQNSDFATPPEIAATEFVKPEPAAKK